MINIFGVAESGDDFTKLSTISQWFQTLIHAALIQRQIFNKEIFL
ncbi:Mobile element protein [Richelia intracellularis]|nr:Mobile element protein [Richelia intracellularis]